MNILIPDSWLRDFLKTKATPGQIAEYLSLCGPSVEKIEKRKEGIIYHIETTTNRVDSTSVYGVAREAAAILPRFKLPARLNPITPPAANLVKKVDYLEAKVDSRLCPRFTAVLISGVKITDSPSWMRERLIAANVRPINNIVDISNYIMRELGQPVHAFDYNKIVGAKMILQASQKGEKITTLDGKNHSLPGGDIIIKDGAGRLIDLAGIMGAENSAVDASTRNVLLFVQTYNPVNIRQTSMSLAHRTEAAVLFEKNLDPELVSTGIYRGIELFAKLTEGKAEKEILDIYPVLYKAKNVEIGYEFMTGRLGVDLPKAEISEILNSLGFETSWEGSCLKVSVPSFRARDIEIPEDIIEEVARIYGYHNFPSVIMNGIIPEPLTNAPFSFEEKIKGLLSGWGGVETYTLSLIRRNYVENEALKLKNPLGAESEYLRDSLLSSLIAAADQNSELDKTFHLFEISNVYLPKRGELPEEKMTLAGVFANEDFKRAKGVIEALLDSLNIKSDLKQQDSKNFLPSRRLEIYSGSTYLGQFGELENGGYLYYEFGAETLRKASKPFGAFKPIPKYPPQIEDLTFVFPERTKIGEVVEFALKTSSLISKIELVDIYKNSYTFRVWYQDVNKTLEDKEVEVLRQKIIGGLRTKFAAGFKG